MPPSDNEMRRSGNFRSTGDHSKSAAHCTMLTGCSVISTSIGASCAVTTNEDDEPMCRHTIVPSSAQACQNGSQCGGIISGMKRPGYAPHHSSTCQSL